MNGQSGYSVVMRIAVSGVGTPEHPTVDAG